MLIFVKVIAIRHRTISFILTMKLWAVFILCAIQSFAALAQQQSIEGIVFDKNSKERIAKVNILNISTNASIYNTLKAEFKVTARKGDILIFSKQNYFNDTIKVGNVTTLTVYLKPMSIELKSVYIKGSFISPQNQLERNKQLYNSAYGSIANHDLLSISSGGVGLSIDALYNMLSRKGRNATRLRETIDRDYQENVIDFRFTHAAVRNITGLIEPQLTDFMYKYRPGYYFVIEASEYEFIKYIRNNFRRYKRNPDAYALEPLNQPDK